MEVSNRINSAVIQAATAMLSPYVPEISPQALVKALSNFQSDGAKNAASAIEKPLTRQQTAELLGISLPTVNRLLNRGTLRRIRITAGSIRIDPGTIRALLNPTSMEE